MNTRSRLYAGLQEFLGDAYYKWKKRKGSTSQREEENRKIEETDYRNK